MKREKLVTNDNTTEMPVSKDGSMPVIGIPRKVQNTQHPEDRVIEEASKEYENRLWAVWTSPLSVPRKVRATNVLCGTCLTVLYVDHRLESQSPQRTRQTNEESYQ